MDSNGINPDPEKINKGPSQLHNITELRRFLGTVNKLSKFTPHLANQTKPSCQLLCSRNQWTWNDSQKRAFQELKALLTYSEMLCPYNPLVVSADAPSFGLRAVLRLWHDNALITLKPADS